MEKLKKTVINALPHATLILAAMFIIFWVLDILNPNMNFVNCKISNKLLLIFCISAIGTSVSNIALSIKDEKNC